MKYMLTMLALACSAIATQAAIQGTGGITYTHKLVCTSKNVNGKEVTTCTKTTDPIIYNLTAYDRTAITGPDNVKRWTPVTSGWLHKALTMKPTDPKIGEVIPNYNNNGGGGPPGGKLDGPTEDRSKNGFLMYKTNWSGATSVTWMRDPVTCGSVFYSQGNEYGAWRFDVANFTPCPTPAPISSSGTTGLGPTLWDLIYQKSGGSPINQDQQEITVWTPQMELDYFKAYGVWANH